MRQKRDSASRTSRIRFPTGTGSGRSRLDSQDTGLGSMTDTRRWNKRRRRYRKAERLALLSTLLQQNQPTAEVRRFTESLRQREPAAMVAPYDRVGLAVRCAVVLSIPRHDQRRRFLSTSSARSACTVITNSLLITSSTIRSVSITNVTRRRGIIGIHTLTPNWRATT